MTFHGIFILTNVVRYTEDDGEVSTRRGLTWFRSCGI